MNSSKSAPSSPRCAPFSSAFNAAWASLKPKEKSIISATTIDDVYREAKSIQEAQAKKKSMRNMRRMERYIDGLNRYSGVISVFVQAKPEILSLIWGPVKLVLQIASNYLDTWDKIMEVLEEIGKALPEFSNMETVFGSSDLLADYLSLFYKEILHFHIQLLELCRHAGFSRLFELLWPKRLSIFGAIIESIKSHKRQIDGQLNVFVINTCVMIRDNTISLLERDQKAQNDRDLGRLREHLKPFDYDEKLREVRDGVCEGTGTWIMKHDAFKRWLDPAQSSPKTRLLWLVGIPGAGKTYLSSLIVGRVEEAVKSSRSGCIAYAFPAYNNQGGSTPSAIIRSLIFNLCCNNPAWTTFFLSECAEGKGVTGKETATQLIHQFETLLGLAVDEPCYILLDGLDECNEKARGWLLASMIGLTLKCSCVHLLVSSRAEGDLEKLLEPSATKLVLNEYNHHDIFEYVEKELDGYSAWKEMKSLYNLDTKILQFIATVPRCITDRADGLFLFARLMVDNIKSQRTARDVLDEAYNLPRNLHEIYGRILERIQGLDAKSQQMAKKILSWLICAKRKLRTVEINHAITIEGDDTILDKRRELLLGLKELCGCILEMNGDYVELVHYSAKEYLIRKEHSGPFIPLSEAQHTIFSTCVSYLCFDYFEDNTIMADERVDEFINAGVYALYDYASSYWLNHAMQSMHKIVSDSTDDDINRLWKLLRVRWNSQFQPSEQRQVSSPPELLALRDRDARLYELLGSVAKFHSLSKTIPGYKAVNAGPLTLTRVTRRILQRFDDLATKLCGDRCSLACAELHQTYGRKSFFRCIIESCPAFETEFETKSMRDAHLTKHERSFRCAHKDCHYSSIGFESKAELERHNINTHVTTMSETDNEVTPVSCNWHGVDSSTRVRILFRAAGKGECGLIQSLLKVPTDGINYEALLKVTARGGSADAFKAIQHSCPNGAFTPANAHNFLEIALQNRKSEGLARYLVENGAMLFRPRMGRMKGFSALHLAIIQGWGEFVEYLISKGAYIELTFPIRHGGYRGHCRPLHAAVLCESDSLVSLLLNNGANINSLDHANVTALRLAIGMGYLSIVRILLQRGAKNNDDEDIVLRHLCDDQGAGNSFNAITPSETTERVLLDWVIRGNELFVQYLLDRGVDANAQGGEYGTILQAAIKNHRENLVRLLLDYGADVNAQGEKYGTALLAAIATGSESLTRLLLDHGADINAQGGEYGTALQAAAAWGRKDFLHILLEHRADINAQGGEYSTALQAAVVYSGSASVHLLLDHGADVNVRGGKYGTALHAAVVHDKVHCVHLLLNYGADFNTQEGDYGTALQAASVCGNETSLRALLDHGVDPNAQGGKYGTALQAAAAWRRGNSLRILLDRGADVNAQGGKYGTALQAAVACGDNASIRLLLDRGADVNTRGGKFNTALQAAAACSDESSVRLLLDLGADINVQGGPYGTALGAAVAHDREESILLLLDRSANITPQTVDGAPAHLKCLLQGSMKD